MASSTQKNSLPVSYAQVTQKSLFPTKEQAIILDAIDGISVQEYTVSIASLIGPSNIRFVSRISQGRVCLYLSNKELADKLSDNHTKVVIGTHTLTIRPLISKAKRIILSNVCPIIPHEVILEELSKINISPVSPISFIKAGINGPGFSHILSFRRQLYVNPEELHKIPESISITYDGTVYWIYLSTEKVACFLCKEEGHLAKFCKKVIVPVESSLEEDAQDKENASQESVIQTKDTDCLMPPPPRAKRTLSELTSSSDSKHSVIKEKKLDRAVKPSKKQKNQSDAGTSMKEVAMLLSPTQEFILENSHRFPIDMNNMEKFLVSSFGKHDVHSIALNYTEDIPSLIKMLSEICARLSGRRLKSRVIRIMNRLSNPDTRESSTDDLSSIEDFE